MSDLLPADVLVLEERVKNTIALGESHFREFKSAVEGPQGRKRARPAKRVAADVAEALVAFANADGGELVVGVEDDGTISGVPHATQDIALMLNAARTNVHARTPLPVTVAQQLVIDGHVVLFFSVGKGTTEVYQLSDGRCVQRKDQATVPAAANAILFDRQEVRSREYDRLFVDGAAVTDLDLSIVRGLAEGYLRGLSAERYLQQVGIAEYTVSGMRLRMAALLLFAQDIQKWHPRSQVRIVRVAGPQLLSGDQYNVISDEIVQGNVFDLLVKAWEKLRPELSYRTELGPDARFEQRYLYPEWACREALVNAIAHRDYVAQNGIDVFVFTDKIQIRSPGELLSSVSLSSIRSLSGAHESRNALIAKVLRENKFMRELGEGMKRIFALMEENELQPPAIDSAGGYFAISLTHKSVFDSRQEAWLSLFAGYGLTAPQRRIVVAGMDGRELSTSDLHGALNTADFNTYEQEVTPLIDSGILVEIRTKDEAIALATRRGVRYNSIPRYQIETPTEKDLPSAAVKARARAEARRTIIVYNLTPNMTALEVESLFTPHGRIARVEVHRDLEDETRASAKVIFTQTSSVAKALDVDGSNYDGRVLSVIRLSEDANDS